MAAPKGNQLWKLRSKHGRNKLFATPELLWEAACEYFAWCDENKWKRATNTKDGIVDMPAERPYSISGMCLYFDASQCFWREFKKANHVDFLPVIARIEGVIETQQFEGATVGAFNANIIARKLGLSEAVNVRQSQVDVNYDSLTQEQREVLADIARMSIENR